MRDRSRHRRDVMNCVASLIDSAFMNGDDWLYVDPKTGEPYPRDVMREREHAADRLREELRRRSQRTEKKPRGATKP